MSVPAESMNAALARRVSTCPDPTRPNQLRTRKLWDSASRPRLHAIHFATSLPGPPTASQSYLHLKKPPTSHCSRFLRKQFILFGLYLYPGRAVREAAGALQAADAGPSSHFTGLAYGQTEAARVSIIAI